MYSYYIEEMVKALVQTPKLITLADDDRFKIDEKLARQVLSKYWENYAVSVFDFRQVVESAERNSVPVTSDDVRKILHDVEEGVVSVDHDAIDEAVTDYASRFDWTEEVNYEAYSLKTCDWLIVLRRNNREEIPEDELREEIPGWVSIRDNAVRVVDCKHTLAEAILMAKAHDEAERDRSPLSPEKRVYQIYSVDYFAPINEETLERFERKCKDSIFDSEYDFYEGFGMK